MSKFKTILACILTPILLCCLAIDIWLFIYYAFGWNNHYSLTTNYIDDMSYVTDTESKYFMNIEYFSNENKNGIENFSAMLNYYTDTTLPEKDENGNFITDKYYYSSGIQFKNGFEYSIDTSFTTSPWYQYYYCVPKNCIYYNVDNQADTTFKATNNLSDQDHWVYDIDGQLCLIKSGKREPLNSTYFLWSEQQWCDINYALLKIYNSCKTLDDGEHILSLDLSEFFHIVMWNEETQKFDIEANSTDEWTFVKVHIKKSSDGFVSASQSMFKAYQGDTKWSLYEISSDGDYWQIDNIYNLKLEQFTFVYENKGYYLKLQDSVINFFKEFKNIRFELSIDLDNIYLGSETIKIDGFAQNAFGGLNVTKIVLDSNNNLTFKTYDKTLNIIHPDNISIEFLEVIAND